MRKLLSAALLLALFLIGHGEAAAQRPPDLTGVWTDYVDPQQPDVLAGGQGGLAPGLPFTEDARRYLTLFNGAILRRRRCCWRSAPIRIRSISWAHRP